MTLESATTLTCVETLHRDNNEQISTGELGWPLVESRQFKHLRGLGSGSFGRVFASKHPVDGSLVAVKAVDKYRTAGDIRTRKELLWSLRREVETLASLQSAQSIVSLRGIYEDDKYAYIAMELCDKGDLQTFLDSHTGPVPEVAVRVLFRQMLETIAYIHEENICYSDVKPANFLLKTVDLAQDPLGLEVKLADFGCSQELSDDDFLTARTGTPLYTAPEVYLGRYGLAADMWGLGIILYRMLSGVFPFRPNLDKVAPFSMMMSVLHDKVSFQGNVWSQVSPEARDLVCKLLHRSLEKRIGAQEALEHPWFSVPLEMGPLSSKYTVIKQEL